jgi:hypothetical protein
MTAHVSQQLQRKAHGWDFRLRRELSGDKIKNRRG